MPASDVNGEFLYHSSDGSNEIIRLGIHWRVSRLKHCLVGSFPIESQFDGSLLNLVDLAEHLQRHQHPHESAKFGSIGVLFMGNPRDYIGAFDIGEPVGGVASSSVGDDESGGAVHCFVRSIADANGSPLLDGRGHGFASIVAGQRGHCPALRWWKLGPGRFQSAWGGKWVGGRNRGVNH